MVPNHPYPFALTIHWGEGIKIENGVMECSEALVQRTIIVREKLAYKKVLEEICEAAGVEEESSKLSVYLQVDRGGQKMLQHVVCDKSLEILYYMAETTASFWGELLVDIKPIPRASDDGERAWMNGLQRGKSMVELLNSFSALAPQVETLIGLDEFKSSTSVSKSQTPGPVREEPSVHDDILQGAEDSHMHANPTVELSYPFPMVHEDVSYESSPTLAPEMLDTDVSDLSDFEAEENGWQETTPNDVWSTGTSYCAPGAPVREFSMNVESLLEEVEEEEKILGSAWKEDVNEIEKEMIFTDKDQIYLAVALWSLKHQREFKVYESRRNTWAARCRVDADNREKKENVVPQRECGWEVRALKSSGQPWRIKGWVPKHKCLRVAGKVGNDNRNIKAKIIGSLIQHSISVDPGYPVMNVQADLKAKLHIDVSYKKAWLGRKKAIESVYGQWSSNFENLPKFIAALQQSNPNTVVTWKHRTNSSATMKIFKYIFWAFGPAIEAFHRCRPVVSIDGTHLRGDYEGKMLVAVVKDANNHILPIAYAIVDAETSDSWSWFLQELRYYVVQNKCVTLLSDRHPGILHATATLDDWGEPYAYHRYCLRHIHANFKRKYKKKLERSYCWALGRTTQIRKFKFLSKQLKALNPKAWNYLNDIDKHLWSLAFDDNRRWGCLTTNISESFNNVLRGARVLPILAIIEMTFHRATQLFNRRAAEGASCDTFIPPYQWSLFRKGEVRAEEHTVQEYNRESGVFRVVTGRKDDYKGGNTHVVKYFDRCCTCGKWQEHKFPCSHAIAVCRYNGDDPEYLVDKFYKIATYKKMYSGKFMPLPHSDYWPRPTFEIKGDETMYKNHILGRKRVNRFHNEMDWGHAGVGR